MNLANVQEGLYKSAKRIKEYDFIQRTSIYSLLNWIFCDLRPVARIASSLSPSLLLNKVLGQHSSNNSEFLCAFSLYLSRSLFLAVQDLYCNLPSYIVKVINCLLLTWVMCVCMCASKTESKRERERARECLCVFCVASAPFTFGAKATQLLSNVRGGVSCPPKRRGSATFK